ncbi:uncharacterized protein LOC132274039 [Cornus florida]|uniref:uncharacterized protein LOC132274039 n=1 Tax=Cornus florida TaxID=4283 RepID=UPI00289C6EB3|nr:uncharacterized protein LOC132274039 [Cornus florida]
MFISFISLSPLPLNFIPVQVPFNLLSLFPPFFFSPKSDIYTLCIPINTPSQQAILIVRIGILRKIVTFYKTSSKTFNFCSFGMASKPVVVAKQLSELLREQQEPFVLEEVSFSCWSCNSNRLLKRSATSGLKRGRKVLPNCSKTVRALFNKLVSIHSHRIKNSVSGDGDFSVTEIQSQMSYRDGEESDRFSSASSTTVFDSCSESDAEEAPNSSERDNILDTADTCQSCNIVPRDHENAIGSQTNGSLSVHKSINLDGGLLAHNKRKKHKAKVMRPVASSTSKLRKSTKVEDVDLLVHTSPQYLKSMRVLQQKNQLLFDCVREAVDVTHVWRKRRRRRRLREVLGPEELGKLLSESVVTWSKQSEETNTTLLLNFDFFDSIEEWSDFEFHIREISMQIVDSILDDIVNEIVTDMIELC